MKKGIKRVIVILSLIFLIVSSSATAFAHSGRTDSKGGHKDNKNVSGLGSYHYHCGGYPAHLHTNGYCPYRDVFPTSVEIKSDKAILGIGEKVSISATVYPENACNTKVSWSCSDSSVISISNGVITAKNYGTAEITAETFNGIKGTIQITVKEITAEKVVISGLPNKEHYYIGESFSLVSQITPQNVDNPSIVWSSSDNTIVSVSENGKVKLLAEGTAEIRATASNGVSARVAITVKEKYVDKVDIAEDQKEVMLGEQINISATVSPSDATHPELVWMVDDPAIASITQDGKITALACGETIVTAIATNGVSDSIQIKVKEIKAETLEISGPKSVSLGDIITLTCMLVPANTTDQTIKWEIDDTSIASISDKGVIETFSVGTIMVTAVQKDVSATYSIEVLPVKVETVNITADREGRISVEETITFLAEVFPENATYPEITWSVSDPEIATIDSNGVLTAMKSGTVIIIATSADGVCSEYELTISSPADSAIGIAAIVGTGVLINKAVKKKKRSKKR